MSSRKFVDWRTVNLEEFNNVVFKDAPTKGAQSAVVKNSKGDFLQFISPTLRTFGIGEMENDGKLAWSISQSLDADAKDAAEYQKFLDRLHAHMSKFCEGGRKPEPLAQFPKIKDPNNPNAFLMQGVNVFQRDKTRSATVRYKVYPERENGMETGCLGVKIYGKGNVPLFDYNDADSRAAFKDEPAPERNWANEKAAVGPGSRVQVLCTARIASMSYGAIFYGTLAATQIKRVTSGDGGGSDRNAPAFALDDEDEEQDAAEPVVLMIADASKKRARDAEVDNSSKKRARAAIEDDGVDDELETAAAPPMAKDDEPAAAEEVVVVVAPPPVVAKKRKLVVPTAAK